MTIGTVVFDLAGVGCRLDRERRITALAKASGLVRDPVGRAGGGWRPGGREAP